MKSTSAEKSLHRISSILQNRGYTSAGIEHVLGVPVQRLAPMLRPMAQHKTQQNSALDVLIRLFVLSLLVSQKEASVLNKFEIEHFCRAGLIVERGSNLVPLLRVTPCQQFYVASDYSHGTAMPDDFVMGVGASTITLARMTIRRPSQRTFDLGTGCGIQAFLASTHSSRVVGSDLNERAVKLAALNAAINDVNNVEFTSGDLFKPVEGQKFDLIISSPPFVISPGAKYLFRDGNAPRNNGRNMICWRIAREAPAYLNEGGYCQMLFNWPHKADANWHAEMAEWFAGTGCDAWVMRCYKQDPAQYTTDWLNHTERDSEQPIEKQFGTWMRFFETKRIEEISGGLIVFRKRAAAKNWFMAEDAPDLVQDGAGEAIDGIFKAQDQIQAGGLLESRLVAAPSLRVNRTLIPERTEWRTDDAELTLAGGLSFREKADRWTMDLLLHCDGRTPLRDLMTGLNGTYKTRLNEVTRLVAHGFLKVV